MSWTVVEMVSGFDAVPIGGVHQSTCLSTANVNHRQSGLSSHDRSFRHECSFSEYGTVCAGLLEGSLRT